MAFRRIPVLVVILVGITLYTLSWLLINSQRISFHFRWTVISGEMDHRVLHESITSNKRDNFSSAAVLNTTHHTWAKEDGTTHGAAGSLEETPIPLLFKKNFKELPRWDFDDVYNQDAQPRNTTCPQPLQKIDDPRFKQAFIPNVRLFLQKEHLNMSEWNRLSHFNNPFGFMEYKHNDVKAAVDLIPKLREPLVPPRGEGECVRCAVVATGGILNGSGMGKEIDAHQYVFRMNNAVIKGYEEDVGNKTSVYVHTALSIVTSRYVFKKYGFTEIPRDKGIKHVMIPEELNDYQWLQGLFTRKKLSGGKYHNYQPWKYYSGQFNESRFYVLHPDFLRYVRNRFVNSTRLYSKYWPLNRPTNGAFTLFLALHTCDEVDAYGFMTEDYSKYPNYYAEKHTKTKVIFYANHDLLLEMKTWKELHNAKIMRLYQRKDQG